MSPAPLIPRPLPPGPADATEQLHLAIAALPHYAVPCIADGHSRDWVCEDEAATARAVEACGACPLLAQCEAFGIATRAEGVVLAGRRWSPWTAKNLATRGPNTTTSPATAGTKRKVTNE